MAEPPIQIGVNLVEILTTGMYKDARTIFREYVQNSCDALDARGATGKINITINSETGYICIVDDGCGIPAVDFKGTMRNIAQSEKSSAENKGFRGIGKLCGIAYCNELVFTATANGENTANSMSIDAKALRNSFYKGLTTSANDLLNRLITFNTTTAEIGAHGFKVELFGVENAELLDADGIKKYLAFVAPVPYSADFRFADKIRAHAAELGHPIDEYAISVNGEAVTKGYRNTLASRGYHDELFDVSFHDFRDEENNLLAWSWIGLTGFRGQINKDVAAGGLRLRRGNIQIGDKSALQSFFVEVRGTYYFVGEVFAVDAELIPNSQRDYFVPNATRNIFEDKLTAYFKELSQLYHGASDVNSAKKKIREYRDVLDKFGQGAANGTITNFFKTKFRLIEAGDKAKQAHENIRLEMKRACESPSSDLSRVIFYLTQNVDEISIPRYRIPAPPPTYRETFRENLRVG